MFGKKSYVDGKYKFDYEISSGITYLALCDEDMKVGGILL